MRLQNGDAPFGRCLIGAELSLRPTEVGGWRAIPVARMTSDLSPCQVGPTKNGHAGRPLPGGVAAFENSTQQAAPPYFQLAFSAAPRAWRLSVPPSLANGKVFRRKGPFCVLERERSPGLRSAVSGLRACRVSPKPWARAPPGAAIRRHWALPSATRPCCLFRCRVKPLLRTCWKIVRLRTRLPKILGDFRGGKLPVFCRLKNPVL